MLNPVDHYQTILTTDNNVKKNIDKSAQEMSEKVFDHYVLYISWKLRNIHFPINFGKQ